MPRSFASAFMRMVAAFWRALGGRDAIVDPYHRYRQPRINDGERR
jgi:hypothetical protein